MNTLIESGVIAEKIYGNNFAYILNDESQFLLTEYKVLQNQGDGCFIKCMKLLYNGRTQFYYLTDGYKSLAEMISVMDADKFLTIVSNFLSNVLTVKNNGFLSCKNVDLSYDRIYIDPSTYKVGLIYLPVKKHFFPDEAAFENELRTGLVKLIAGEERLSTPKIQQFKSDLSNGILSLQELYQTAKGGSITSSALNRQNRPENMQTEGRMKIIALNAPDRVILNVDKREYVIGKNSSAVDGVITFNRMISRIHCKVVNDNGMYSIEDLNSANGTYVNQVRLQPNRPHPIKNGDIVRLANSDFQILIN